MVRIASFVLARCKAVDLNRWLGGHYRVPSQEPAETAERPEPREFPEEE